MPLTSDTQTTPWIAALTDAGVQADVQAAVAAGGFTYSNMLTLLQDVAKSVTAAGTSTTPGALTASQLSSLQAVAAHLNNGVSCDDYLASIFQQCVDGSPMNADWTGGSATATALGNLAIGSSATQINELIGKWFLGTDLPEPGAASYQNYTAPLFGPTGGPSTSDVMQGETGDCEFLSGLNDLVTNDPSAAKSMIVSDGNGVYGVRFYINGVETWVTVNSELPTSGVYGGLLYNDLQATNPTDLWASLVEKAYAQLSSSGQIGHPAVNSYANIDGDSAGNVFSDLTDSSQAAYYWHSDANWTAEKAIIVAAVESGDDVNVESYGDTKNAAGKTTFVSGHAFAVVGYDATTGDFILRNPWGTYDSTVDYQFEASMSDVAGVSGDFVVSNSANDAVEIRAAAQDQMAVGTTSVANLLSVVDTTGAQVTQYMFEMVGAGSINLNGATNLATTAQTAQGQVVVSAADLSKLTVGETAAGNQTLLAWASDGTVWSPVTDIGLDVETATVLPSQNVNAFGSLTGVTMTTGSGKNATTFVSNLALASMFNLQGADLTKGSYQFNLLSGGTFDLNGASPWATGTGQIDINASDLSKVQFTLAPGANSASFDVFYTDGTHSWSDQIWTVKFSGLSANAGVQDYDNGNLAAVGWVNDTAANMFANLDSLQTMFTAHALQAASVTDSVAPTESITGAQFVSDMGVLSILSGKFALDITGMSAANIVADLASLEADAGHIASIAATDTPVAVGAITAVLDQAALDKIAGGFDIVVGVPTNFVANLGAINADVGHIDTITSPNGPIVVSAAAFESNEAALDMIVGGFEVNDQSANFVASLGALEADVSHIQSISFADSLPPTLNLTAAQASADAILLAKVASPYILNVANADGSTTTTGFGQGLTFAVPTGNDTIAATNGGATTGAVSFGSGISDEDLWFQQVGDNLQIDVMGTSHSLTINDWFGGTNPAAVQGFIAGGLTLDKQVSHLVQAMATYAANDSSFNPSAISQAPNDKTLQSAIAAAWHH